MVRWVWYAWAQHDGRTDGVKRCAIFKKKLPCFWDGDDDVRVAYVCRQGRVDEACARDW